MNREAMQEMCVIFNATVLTMFPGFYTNTRVQNILGDVIAISMGNVAPANAPMGIIENSSFYFRGLIQNTKYDKTGSFYMDCPAFLPREVKFRKISGATEGEVLEKLIKWLTKNHAQIVAIKVRTRAN